MMNIEQHMNVVQMPSDLSADKQMSSENVMLLPDGSLPLNDMQSVIHLSDGSIMIFDNSVTSSCLSNANKSSEKENQNPNQRILKPKPVFQDDQYFRSLNDDLTHPEALIEKFVGKTVNKMTTHDTLHLMPESPRKPLSSLNMQVCDSRSDISKGAKQTHVAMPMIRLPDGSFMIQPRQFVLGKSILKKDAAVQSVDNNSQTCIPGNTLSSVPAHDHKRMASLEPKSKYPVLDNGTVQLRRPDTLVLQQNRAIKPRGGQFHQAWDVSAKISIPSIHGFLQYRQLKDSYKMVPPFKKCKKVDSYIITGSQISARISCVDPRMSWRITGRASSVDVLSWWVEVELPTGNRKWCVLKDSEVKDLEAKLGYKLRQFCCVCSDQLCSHHPASTFRLQDRRKRAIEKLTLIKRRQPVRKRLNPIAEKLRENDNVVEAAAVVMEERVMQASRPLKIEHFEDAVDADIKVRPVGKRKWMEAMILERDTEPESSPCSRTTTFISLLREHRRWKQKQKQRMDDMIKELEREINDKDHGKSDAQKGSNSDSDASKGDPSDKPQEGFMKFLGLLPMDWVSNEVAKVVAADDDDDNQSESTLSKNCRKRKLKVFWTPHAKQARKPVVVDSSP